MIYYAGIGPRKTPTDIQATMTSIAKQLSPTGWCLRSGHAHGADRAFEKGAVHQQIFLPWDGFNGAYANGIDKALRPIDQRQVEIAAEHHPAWDAMREDGVTPVLTQNAKMLLCRNVPILLGENLDDPVACVIYWTENDSYSGGTMHAIRIASTWGIPTFNIRKEADQVALCKFTWDYENQVAARKVA